MQAFFCFTQVLFAQISLPKHSGSIEFIENKNQWEKNILYKADIREGAFFLEKNCFTFVFKDMAAINKLLEYKYKSPEKCEKLTPSDYNVKCYAYKINFLNSKQDVIVTADEPKEGYYNYYTGNNKTNWSSKIKSYSAVAYKGLYEKTDLNIYENNFHLKYDITLHPGANANNIQFQYEGADKVFLRNGNLIVKTSVNEVTELSPEAFQIDGGSKVKVPCKFKLTDNILSFVFPDGYDKTKEIIIDPVLIFSTYSGSTADNWGFTATFDSHGRVYSGGIAFGTGYPVTLGAFQINFAGGETGAYLSGCDVAIIKYDSSGTQRLWATYLGGSRNELPHSMIVDDLDELVVYGTTGSSNFPVTSGAYDQTFNGGDSIAYDFNSIKFSHGIDIFVSKLSADGTQLLASTYIGGTKNDGMNYPSVLSKNYADGARGEIMTDANNNVYVVSTTNSVDFPVTPGAFQPTSGGGGQDGVVFKMDANLSNLIWSSYLGGNGSDAVYGIVLDDNDNVYVTGGTTSTNFPTTSGVLHPNYMGNPSDGFITKISANGNSILKSTYYGSNAYDQSYLIETDKNGNIYVFGQTAATGNTFIYNAAWATPNGGQFISKINSDLNTLIWSTAFGTGSGGPDISPTAFLVDLCGKIYLSGWGGPNINGFGGTAGLPITPNAFQNTTDNNDYYFLVISDDASSLIYATYFGSPHALEHVDGGTSRFDRNGRIYQGVCAGCGGWDDFPTTPGAWSTTNNSTNCNNGVIKFDFMLPLIIAGFDIPAVGCAPYNAYFHNTSSMSGGIINTCFWSFGDGGTSTQYDPSHIYTQSGIFNVMLVVSDTGSCNLSDTITKQVVVLNNSIDTLPVKYICLDDFIQIGLLPLPDPSITYQWIPAAGLSNDTISNPIADPAVTTNYILLVSNGICTDTIKQKVEVRILTIDAGHDTTICSGNVLLTAISTGGTNNYIWSTSPNLTDTLNNPITNNYVLVNPTTTTIYYVKVSNQYCDEMDSVKVIISDVNINLGNNQTICNGDTVSINVTNLNPSNPLTYQWSPIVSIISGANSSTVVVSPDTTTLYIVTATDALGCQKTDTVTILVSVIISDLITDSVNCFGDCNGSASLNPTGGISPYSYQWSGGQTTPNVNGLCSNNYSVTITDNSNCKLILPFTIHSPQPLVASISNSGMVDCDSICDGYATLLVSGGTLSYQYLWIDGQITPTADGLCAGNYSVTITDNHGCTTNLPVNIFDTSNFFAVDSIIPPSCYGYCDASAFIIANGGLQPYTYNWNNGEHGPSTDSLCAGIHNVMVFEAGGCIRDIFFNINQPTHVVLIPTVITDPSCAGLCNGQITMNASGGTPSYTYVWSNSQTGSAVINLCNGTYYITAYDSHNCPQVDTLTLVEPTPLLENVIASNVPCDEICNGMATVSASGSVPPYSYLWSNGFTVNPATGLCSGTYTVTVTDSHLCSDIDTVVVKDSTVFPPMIHTYADDTIIYSTQNTELHTTIISGFTYSWLPTTGLSNPSSPEPTATPTSTTTYYVTIVDQYGCTYIDSVKVYVIDVLCNESQIFVPNAFTPNGDNNNDVVYVRSGVMKSIYFVIYDRWGEKVFETYDISQGWDGTFRGKACDPGVFDYYMKAICIDDKEFIKKGNITLIR
jgi:gliding motility-associated-like protein